MRRPELSVIVPSYGRAALAARAVASALAQDVDLEVILVDDGSPEPLRVPADDRVTVLRLPENRGAAAARNAGAAAAGGDWITFLDSDDAWRAGSLAPRLAAARAGGEGAAAIWCAGFADVSAEGTQTRTRFPIAASDPAVFAAGCWSCPGSTALLSRAAWARSGGQDESLRRLEDYDWLLRWSLGGGVLRAHPSLAADIRRGARAAVEPVEQAAHRLLNKHDALAAPLKRRMKSYLSLEIAASRLHAGQALGGVSALARSWLLHPRMQPALEPFWTQE